MTLVPELWSVTVGNNSCDLGTIKDRVGSLSLGGRCPAEDDELGLSSSLEVVVVASPPPSPLKMDADEQDGTTLPLMLNVTSMETCGPSDPLPFSYAELSSRYTKQPTVELLPYAESSGLLGEYH